MENEIVVPAGMPKKEWFTTAEFAARVGIGTHSLRQWLKNHPEFTVNYCQNVSTNPKIKSWLIHESGVAPYISLKSKGRGTSDVQMLTTAKQRVGEKANEALARKLTPEEMMLETARLLVGLSNRLDNAAGAFAADHKKLEYVEGRLEKIETEMNKPLPVTSLHRQFLNDRVRMYAIKTDMDFRRVWQALNTHTGRGGVAFYEFQDFQKAKKYLKDMYEQAGLEW